MDDNDPQKYCSIKPFFPEKIFIATIFIMKGDNTTILPLRETKEKIVDFSPYIRELFEEFDYEAENIKIMPQVIIFPLIFDSLVPLKREYWENTLQNYQFDMRSHDFLYFIDKPSFYKILITPGNYDSEKNRFSLNAAIPLKIDSKESDLNKFMMYSDFPVHEYASHSAFYIPQQPLRYNYTTLEIDQPEKNYIKKKSN